MDEENLVDPKKSKVTMIKGNQRDQSISMPSKIIISILLLFILCLAALLLHQSKINKTSLTNDEMVLSREKRKLKEPIESTDAILARDLQRKQLMAQKAQQDTLVEGLQKTIKSRDEEIKEQISHWEKQQNEKATNFKQGLNDLRRVVESLAAEIREFRNETSQQMTVLEGRGLRCDTNWKYFAGYCYWIDTSRYDTYHEAKPKCQQRNSNLVSIHSKEEQNFVAGLAPDKQIRLGLSFHGDKWEWSDGSKVDYTSWDDGQLDKSKHYMWAEIHHLTRRWHNYVYSDSYTVCKKLAGI